jgi:hypothetical protein
MAKDLGEHFYRGRVGGINGLEDERCPSGALVCETVADLYQLGFEGRPREIAQEPTPEPGL